MRDWQLCDGGCWFSYVFRCILFMLQCRFLSAFAIAYLLLRLVAVFTYF